MKYEVTVVKTGYIYVEADSKDEAMSIADNQSESAVNWCDYWGVTDAIEDEDPDFHEEVCGYIRK